MLFTKPISVDLDQLGFGVVKLGEVEHQGDCRGVQINCRVGEVATATLEVLPSKVQVDLSGAEIIFRLGNRAFRVVEDVDPSYVPAPSDGIVSDGTDSIGLDGQ